MIFMRKLYISIFLFVTIFSSSFCQEVKLTASFDSTRIFIGDQIKFYVTIDQPTGLKLALPILKDTLCKNIDILSGPLTDTLIGKAGRMKIREKYLITSYDSGHYQVNPIFAEMKNENGMKRFYSDYSQLEVMRVKIAPADTTLKIYDIIKPYRAPVTVGEILPWVLLVIFLGFIIWIVIKYLRKLERKKNGIEVIINSDPAHVIAFRELEKLREEKLWQNGQIKSYYTKLTDILRQYLENRFKVFSLELTTYETLDALVKTGFKKDESYNQLKSVLTGADLVKFAKYNPEPSENELHFQSSWNFVLATKENEVSTEPIIVKENIAEARK
jgi:hypothetical protein